MKLRTYMAGSRGHFEEGAVLVFAPTVKAARLLAWEKVSWMDEICDGYIDLAAKRLDRPHLMAEAVSDQPHVVESPKLCPCCETWGYPLDGDGCEGCCEATPEGGR